MSDSCDPVDCSLPSSSVHGVLHRRFISHQTLLCSGIFNTFAFSQSHSCQAPSCHGAFAAAISHIRSALPSLGCLNSSRHLSISSSNVTSSGSPPWLLIEGKTQLNNSCSPCESLFCVAFLFAYLTIWLVAGFRSPQIVNLRALVPPWLLPGGHPQFLPHWPLHWATHNTAGGFIRVSKWSEEVEQDGNHHLL